MEFWLGSSGAPYRFQEMSLPHKIQDMNGCEGESAGEEGGRKKGNGKEKPSAEFKAVKRSHLLSSKQFRLPLNNQPTRYQILTW